MQIKFRVMLVVVFSVIVICYQLKMVLYLLCCIALLRIVYDPCVYSTCVCQYYRFSVGGMTDVAEIKGHRSDDGISCCIIRLDVCITAWCHGLMVSMLDLVKR